MKLWESLGISYYSSKEEAEADLPQHHWKLYSEGNQCYSARNNALPDDFRWASYRCKKCGLWKMVVGNRRYIENAPRVRDENLVVVWHSDLCCGHMEPGIGLGGPSRDITCEEWMSTDYFKEDVMAEALL